MITERLLRSLRVPALVAFGAAVVAAAPWAGCYNPSPSEGAFSCSADLGGLCPGGFVCSPAGLCVRTTGHDMGGSALDLAGDQATAPFVRSCEQRVSEGAFSNLTALTPANTAGDEEHIALDPSGSGRLLFQRANQLYVSTFVGGDPKSISTPQLVTLNGGPATPTLLGGSFTSDGKLWFAATDTGVTGLYTGVKNGDAAFDVTGPRQPTASGCPFSDPSFVSGDAAQDLFAAYALAGCSGVSYAVRGAVDRNLGAFYSALMGSGWSAPSLTSSGTLLIVSSTSGGRHLATASRTDTSYQFTSTASLPMSAIGAGTEDRQAVVSNDCSTIYFSSVRSGGAGGADLYAADIAAE